MSWSDLVNGVVVGFSPGDEKPTKVPRGVWVRNRFINEHYDPIMQIQEGPVVDTSVDPVTYTYTLTNHPDRVERYRQDILDRIYVEQMVRENAGVTLSSGLKVETTDDAVAKIHAELDGSRGNPAIKRKFNGRYGRGDLSLQDMEDILDGIRDHKRAVNVWAYDASIQVVDPGVTTVAALKALDEVILP